MKRILAFLILTSCAIAGTWMASPGAGSHGAGAPVGPTFLINETFEGTGTPTDWFTGGADFDSTTSPLAGAQSARADTGEIIKAPSMNEGTYYGKFLFRTNGFTDVSNIMEVNDGSSSIFRILIETDGTVTIDTMVGPTATTVATMAANTLYYVWFLYQKGSGSNGVYRVWFNTVNTKPADGSNNSAGGTDMTHTTNFVDWYMSLGGSATIDFDNVQGATTAIP